MPVGVYVHSEEHKKKVSLAMKGRKKSEEHKRKIKENHADLSGKNHPNYNKFGEDANGWNPKSNHITFYKLQARRTMEKKIGRKLKFREVVHHLDFNKENNQFDNIHLFHNPSEHMIYHGMLRRFVNEILGGNIKWDIKNV